MAKTDEIEKLALQIAWNDFLPLRIESDPKTAEDNWLRYSETEKFPYRVEARVRKKYMKNA